MAMLLLETLLCITKFEMDASEGIRYGGMVPIREVVRTKKTPEMNELEWDNIPLKIWASEIENSKNESIFSDYSLSGGFSYVF